jgi:hypothetical protein
MTHDIIEHIAEFIAEEIKEFDSYKASSWYNKGTATVRVMVPNVFIRVNPNCVTVNYWRPSEGVDPITMEFDHGDPTMIDTIVNNLHKWQAIENARL